MINGNDILLAGYPPGPHIARMLEAAREYEARGVHDTAYLLKLLKRDFPPPPPKRTLRKEPAPLAEAITPTCELDEMNIGHVRRFMHELLVTPVIQRGAIMPDACPAGSQRASMPVGGAIVAANAILPGAHSADICCSMHATFFRSPAPVKKQMDALMASTRFGFGGRKEQDWVSHPVLNEHVWDNPFLTGLQRHAAMHLADQGDGNHFAYLGEVSWSAVALESLRQAGHSDLAEKLAKPETGHQSPGESVKWQVLVTHHGSRGLGAHVYKRGMKAAQKQTHAVAVAVPEAAAWLDFGTEEGAAYWEALAYVGRWTKANHQCIHARFLQNLGITAAAEFGNEHNFVWKRGSDFYHGKGATPAWRDEAGRPQLGLIPLNMAAPILIVLGRDNRDFLSFAPHGAGRNLSRAAVLKPFRQKDGTYDTKMIQEVLAEHTSHLDLRWWHGKPDLSESPIGYKPAEQVKAQIAEYGLADVIAEINPLGCVMAGDAGPRPWEREKDLTPKQKRQIEHRADRRKVHQQLKHAAEELDED